MPRYPLQTPDITTPHPDNDRGFPTPLGDIPREVYQRRRQRLMEQMGSGVAVVFAADTIDSCHRQNLDFYYLTGLAHEAGAALVLAPEHPAWQEQLFLRPLDIEDNRWHGNRPMLGRASELAAGIASVKRTTLLPRAINDALMNSKNRELVYLGPFAGYTSPVPKQLTVLREVAQRVLGCTIRDGHDLLPRMRSIHDRDELALMRRAIEATEAAFTDAMHTVQPDTNEDELLFTFERAIRTRGCRRFAYEPIIGSGPNSCGLHYTANDRIMRAGELVLCDVGAEFQMYAADITRTFPVSGTFTPRQREINDIVHEAWRVAVDMCRPGVTFLELGDAARNVIENAGYCDQYFHGLGHFLGLDVHDAGLMNEPLAPGMVITIEPGIYIADENLGIRLEDDILITDEGCEILSTALPRTSDEIEAFMAKR